MQKKFSGKLYSGASKYSLGPKKYFKGKISERAVVNSLKKNNFQVIAKNISIICGSPFEKLTKVEIDIMGRNNSKEVWIIEVKTISRYFDYEFGILKDTQKYRLIKAQYKLQKLNPGLRFYLVLATVDYENKIKFYHLT